MHDADADADLDDGLRSLDAPTPTGFARLLAALTASARRAGAGAVASGQWAASTVIDIAPRIPVRDIRTLETQLGLTGAELAEDLVRRAVRASAVAGAAGGALVSAGELAPPAWVAIPFELVAQTIGVAAIELKLIAELHEVYGYPVTGAPSERAAALARAWADRRGVTMAALAKPGGLSTVLGRGTRNELVRAVRRRLVARLGRNLSTLAPLLVGAAAGAEVNRRATRALGEAVRRDLVNRPQRAEPPSGMEG